MHALLTNVFVYNSMHNEPLQSEVESRTQGSRPRTQKNFAAKDQGYRRKCSPKKKVFKTFFRRSQKKEVFKKFFLVIST